MGKDEIREWLTLRSQGFRDWRLVAKVEGVVEMIQSVMGV